MAAKGRKAAENERTASALAPKKGVKITITGEDGSKILFFSGKKNLKVTITTEDGSSKLMFCSGANPVDECEEEDPEVAEE